ncbi:MAG: hypothetical protein DRR08_01780 [Candidatus Parabeggiatoa sp. nov. 2]|nr:MAG: hypothetical protein B6247_00290 [Beggiatoa sp. 4572_84]RKZ64104.1 MAG: hypothetical protein DRR08_01780 [Gammaproteobacteria bacterium]HEC86240.1 hypothetical protein [Thioploca sp.]
MNMKIHHVAIIFGLTMMPISYAQPEMEQGTNGVNSPDVRMPGEGRWGMPGHGMGRGQGMQWRQGANLTNPATIPQSLENKSRLFVEMPPKVQQVLLQDMSSHQAALIQVYTLLAEGKLNEAADIAEVQMGNSARGKHRGTGMGPGRFMPFEMRRIGWSMHESASEFARIAKKADITQAQAYAVLQKVTAACVACHYSYRIR